MLVDAPGMYCRAPSNLNLTADELQCFVLSMNANFVSLFKVNGKGVLVSRIIATNKLKNFMV